MPTARAFVTTVVFAAAACGGEAVGARELHLATAPTRIVAGSVFATEVLLDIAPRERIAAVHYVAADPSWSLVAEQVAGLRQVGAEPEDLLAVAPDLVIVDPFTRPETLAILASAGIPVLQVGEARGFADIADNIRAVGRACHLGDEADRLVGAMEQRLAALREHGARLTAVEVLSLDGALHTYGRGSLFDAVVGAAGARNVAAERGVGPFRKLDFETLLAWAPQVLVIDMVSGSEAGERTWLAQGRGFHLLPALRDDRVVFLPSSRFNTTSHRLADTVAYLQDALSAWRPQ